MDTNCLVPVHAAWVSSCRANLADSPLSPYRASTVRLSSRDLYRRLMPLCEKRLWQLARRSIGDAGTPDTLSMVRLADAPGRCPWPMPLIQIQAPERLEQWDRLA